MSVFFFAGSFFKILSVSIFERIKSLNVFYWKKQPGWEGVKIRGYWSLYKLFQVKLSPFTLSILFTFYFKNCSQWKTNSYPATVMTYNDCVHLLYIKTRGMGYKNFFKWGNSPFPCQTSARWQPLSPGSLQNSTTSRHVVSGVMGTSVSACSPSLKYTIKIIWETKRIVLIFHTKDWKAGIPTHPK